MISHEMRVLLRYARPYRWTLIGSSLLLLGGSLLALSIPWQAGRFAAALLQTPESVPLNQTVLLLLLVLSLQTVFSFGSGYLLWRTAEQLLAELKVAVFDHLQSLPIGYYHGRKQGEILTLLARDVGVLSTFITSIVVKIAPVLFTFAGAAVLMIWIDPILGLIAALATPALFLILKLVSRRLRALSSSLADSHADAFAVAEENLGMLAAIKSFTREKEASQRYRDQVDRVFDLSIQQLRIQSALSPIIRFLAASIIVLLLFLGAQHVREGTLDPAQLVSFLMYGLLLAQPVSSLADLYGQTRLAMGASERLIAVLGESPEQPALHPFLHLGPVRGHVSFENVSFRYPGRDSILKDVSFEIREGETVALTGPNGAGKSTLAHLLLRLHPLNEGKIRIDGQNIQDVSLVTLRSQIGLVPQNILLFNGTVAENIAYGRLGASREDLLQAARAARAHDFIQALPQGYQTLIGDRGRRLSGGQKQRIALARALLKNPPILILDEATAMFDPSGEGEFVTESRDLLAQRTVILITHRPASLELADRIFYVDQRSVRLVSRPRSHVAGV